MRVGIITTAIIVCAFTGTANAQQALYMPDPLLSPCAVDPPTELPPLLPVPEWSPVPKKSHPNRSKRPQVEYDRSLLYLPESIPQSEVATVLENPRRFWITPSLIVGWTSPAEGNSTQGFPGDGLAIPARLGYAVNVGGWFTNERTTGLEFGGLYLSQGVARSGPTLIASPAGLALANSEFRDRYITAFAFAKRQLLETSGSRFDLLLGYRFAQISEAATSSIAPQTLFTSQSQTNFYGGTLGFAGSFSRDAWTIGLTGLIAFGNSYRTGSANTQDFDDNHFALLPTLNVRVERAVFKNGRAFVGYDFQYLTRDSEDQQIFNGANGMSPRNAEFWFQAVSAGLEIRF